MVFRLDIGLKFARSDFGEPGFLAGVKSELSTGRMDPRVGSGRVGSGRVTILPDFGGSGRVGSALQIF